VIGTEQFNNVDFIHYITTLSQDNKGAQSLLNAIQEFEHWIYMRLNLGKTVVVDIDGGLRTQTLLSWARPWLVRVFQTRRTLPPPATLLEGAETAVSLFKHWHFGAKGEIGVWHPWN
jgi:hypothetical protein